MILLDTHVIIWDALTPNRLSIPAQQAIAHANGQAGMLIADISLWEIAMLIQKGRIQINTDCQSFITLLLQANKLRVVPISPLIATWAVQLPGLVNKDPADRLIVATALAEKAVLVTADLNLQSSGAVTTLW
ncbi:MAG: type II toxin-antitoxin system VapC family toxin [Caldilinea sp. CFX5]|nr:type II toxin-antitoxin system VapC family toxin [Caldilinea sp. CFX5]